MLSAHVGHEGDSYCKVYAVLQSQMVTHLAIARRCNPGFSERFNLFVKEREHSQASESDNSGEGAKDLVSIVEFQVFSVTLQLFLSHSQCA